MSLPDPRKKTGLEGYMNYQASKSDESQENYSCPKNKYSWSDSERAQRALIFWIGLILAIAGIYTFMLSALVAVILLVVGIYLIWASVSL